jgi:hypothetical protein
MEMTSAEPENVRYVAMCDANQPRISVCYVADPFFTEMGDEERTVLRLLDAAKKKLTPGQKQFLDWQGQMLGCVHDGTNFAVIVTTSTTFPREKLGVLLSRVLLLGNACTEDDLRNAVHAEVEPTLSMEEQVRRVFRREESATSEARAALLGSQRPAWHRYRCRIAAAVVAITVVLVVCWAERSRPESAFLDVGPHALRQWVQPHHVGRRTFEPFRFTASPPRFATETSLPFQ